MGALTDGPKRDEPVQIIVLDIGQPTRRDARIDPVRDACDIRGHVVRVADVLDVGVARDVRKWTRCVYQIISCSGNHHSQAATVIAQLKEPQTDNRSPAFPHPSMSTLAPAVRGLPSTQARSQVPLSVSYRYPVPVSQPCTPDGPPKAKRGLHLG